MLADQAIKRLVKSPTLRPVVNTRAETVDF